MQGEASEKELFSRGVCTEEETARGPVLCCDLCDFAECGHCFYVALTGWDA